MQIQTKNRKRQRQAEVVMDRQHIVDCIVVERLRIGTLFKLNLIGNALL